MAKFIDVDETQEEVNEGEFASIEEESDETSSIENTGEDIQEQEDSQEEQTELPEKYKGKTVDQIIKMHQEAEKLLGRHSSEVGELRSIVDDFIKSNLDKESPQEEEDDVDFWSDPEKAFEKRLANHPSIKKFEETTKNLSRQEVVNRLNTEYPDWQDTIQQEDFANWVRGSNKRMSMYAEASNNFDWDAASELLGTWQQLNKAKKDATATAKEDVKQQRKTASTGTSKSADAQPSKKIYRRSDIINLMQRDPERYAQLSDEITRAYQEGRVK